MRKGLLLPLFLALLLAETYQTIIITQPAITNFSKNQVQYWFANFGSIHYNKPMSFSIYASNQSLCEKTNISQFTNPTYIVVKQGQCQFTKKAEQAQLLGAQGIIIATKDIDYAVGNVVLSDDGQGRKVRIATLFIRPEDFDKLATLNNAKIKVNYELLQRDKSNIDLFLSASGRQNYIFLRNFRKYYNKLKDNIKLSVNYHTIQCKSCDESECILQKTCCTFDLDNFQSGLGRYIIFEQFRQYKIFTYFSEKNKIDQWFQYMDQFDKRCDYDWMNSEMCSKKIQQQLGIKQLSFYNQDDLKENWRKVQVKSGIISLPDMSVNGYRHVELLSADSAYQMICQSLSNSPSSCGQQPPNNGRFSIIVVVIISSIIFIVLGVLCYKKIIKRQITGDMSSKVNQLVARYAAKVSEQKKKRKDEFMQKLHQQI